MKKPFYILFTLVTTGFFLAGCSDFLDINTSKDSPTTVTVDQALPPAVFYAAQQVYDHAEYGVYLSQALTTSSKGQTGSYAYSSGWEFLNMNRHPQWRRHFYDLGANINELVKAAKKIDSKNFELIARTIMLQSTMLTTDVFGDMPRENAYLATSPTYDTQEDIYKWMFQEADDLLALYLDPNWAEYSKNIPITEKMDRIYVGDLKKWELYTKALRARLWLRKLPNWENTPEVCNKIIAMVDEVLNDPAWEEPRFRYSGGTGEQNAPWGSYAPIINAWESRGNRLASSIPTAFFAYGILGAYTNTISETIRRYALDPRTEGIMTMRGIPDVNGSTKFRWLESNIGMDVSMRVTYYPDLFASGVSNPYTRNEGYVALITDEELMFIKAEAQYWAGDKVGAYNTTKNAAVHNMARFGIVESELVGNNAKNRYKNYFEVRLPGENLFTIADLMQQKYVAMYLQPEQWNDMRRYNYSSKTNGIMYDNVPVYTVTKCHNGTGGGNIGTPTTFTAEYSLRRPYNLYVPYWMKDDSFGQNAELSPNAWINRINYDPETEDKYNKKELERLGAYKNADWLKKRMIWQYNKSGKAVSNDATEWK